MAAGAGPLERRASIIPLYSIICAEIEEDLNYTLTTSRSRHDQGGVAREMSSRIDVCAPSQEQPDEVFPPLPSSVVQRRVAFLAFVVYVYVAHFQQLQRAVQVSELTGVGQGGTVLLRGFCARNSRTSGESGENSQSRQTMRGVSYSAHCIWGDAPLTSQHPRRISTIIGSMSPLHAACLKLRPATVLFAARRSAAGQKRNPGV